MCAGTELALTKTRHLRTENRMPSSSSSSYQFRLLLTKSETRCCNSTLSYHLMRPDLERKDQSFLDVNLTHGKRFFSLSLFRYEGAAIREKEEVEAQVCTHTAHEHRNVSVEEEGPAAAFCWW